MFTTCFAVALSVATPDDAAVQIPQPDPATCIVEQLPQLAGVTPAADNNRWHDHLAYDSYLARRWRWMEWHEATRPGSTVPPPVLMPGSLID